MVIVEALGAGVKSSEKLDPLDPRLKVFSPKKRMK